MLGKKRFIVYAALETCRFLLVASLARGAGFMSGPFVFLYLSLASATLAFPLFAVLLAIDPRKYDSARKPLGIAKTLQALATFAFLLSLLMTMAETSVPGMPPYLGMAALISFILLTDGMGIGLFLAERTDTRADNVETGGERDKPDREFPAAEITVVESQP